MAENNRLSNIELLRIISMLLVLVVHASFKAIGVPSSSEVLSEPISTFLRFTSESISIICVNIFVFISGWFSIKPKLSRLCEFLFQVIFYWVLIFFIMALYGKTQLICTDIVYKLLTHDSYWFVRAYIILYVLSPMLNSFIDNSQKSVIKSFLILFYTVQTLFGFLFNNNWYDNGYSPLSFIGLYILARYLRIYPCSLLNNKIRTCGIYFISIIILDIIACYCSMFSTYYTWKLYSYSSPLVILLSVCFFNIFVNINIKSNFINRIATSCFSVYLLHTHLLIFDTYYLSIISKWFVSESRLVFFLYSLILIICYFTSSIVLDKIRIFIWKSMYNALFIKLIEPTLKSGGFIRT